MIAPWFKFYGSEYLSDPKMLALIPSMRSCWITLLCYASLSGIDGKVRHLSEEALMTQAGIYPTDEEWDRTKGVLAHFEKLSMIQIDNGEISITNWKKRQETNLTAYERLKKHRDKKRNDNADETQVKRNDNARGDKRRVDKIRVEKSIKYLESLPKKDIEEFIGRFVATEKEIKSKAEDLKLYCERKGREYKNYKSFLLNALKRDFKERDGTAKGGKYAHLT